MKKLRVQIKYGITLRIFETELKDNYPLLTQEADRELVFRHEMHNTDTESQGWR